MQHSTSATANQPVTSPSRRTVGRSLFFRPFRHDESGCGCTHSTHEVAPSSFSRSGNPNKPRRSFSRWPRKRLGAGDVLVRC